MLIEFRFKNYRSFRDEAVLSMEATGLGAFKNSLIPLSNTKRIIPAAAIYGKNGGGKSNVIRAFWLAVQFIRNAQRTQHDNAPVPVMPFMLDDYSSGEPTEFHFVYTIGGVRYWYGFTATKEKIISEYLYHAPKAQKALVFMRDRQSFTFTSDVSKRKLISETVAANQLFFSVACTLNDADCVGAMTWFRDCVYFSRNYSDIPRQLLEYSEDKNMLKAITDYAKAADLGIQDMSFEFNSRELDNSTAIPDSVPETLRKALGQFMQALSDAQNASEIHLKMGQVSAKATHLGKTRSGQTDSFSLDLSEESDGTRMLMSIAPAIESVLKSGGILLVDELDRELHPILVNYIVAKFQSKNTNVNGAQIVYTTHNTELLNLELLRKDQI